MLPLILLFVVAKAQNETTVAQNEITTVANIQGQVNLCPKNLPRTHSLEQFGGSCYEFHLSQEKDWFYASEDCKRRGGFLVHVQSREEQTFVYDYLKRHIAEMHHDKGIWLGLTDQGEEGRWKWTSDDPLNYQNWAPNQPGILRNLEDCALLEVRTGEWHDYSCHGFLFKIEAHGWLCQYDLATEVAATTSAPGTTIVQELSTQPPAISTMIQKASTLAAANTVTCGSFVCQKDCGIRGYAVDSHGCPLCSCQSN